MSEPTGDGNQKPDPEHPATEQGQGENQDQSLGSVFNDPTAPVWADPTTPLPTPPSGSGSGSESGSGSAWVQDEPPVAPTPPGMTPPPPQASPMAAPPLSNPYAQQPPPPEAAGQYGQPYGQPQPGQPYPAYGQQNYATGAAPSNTSAIILTIVSGLATLTTCVIGIPSLIFGIMALTSNSTDPVGSRSKARTGWIIFAINAGVVILGAIAIVSVVLISGSSTSNSNSGY